MDQMLLCICLFIYRDAQDDQICTFIIVNEGKIYTRQDITKRYNELNLTRKRSSHEAYRVNTPANVAKAIFFVSHPPPLGVSNIRLDQLIDMDETGFYLPNVKTKYGQGHTSCWIQYPSHYTRADPNNQCNYGYRASESDSETVC